MSKKLAEPKTYKCRGVTLIHQPSRKLVKAWAKNPVSVSVFLETLVRDKIIGTLETIILYNPDHLELATLVRGAEVYKFVHSRPERKKAKSKKSFSQLASGGTREEA